MADESKRDDTPKPVRFLLDDVDRNLFSAQELQEIEKQARSDLEKEEKGRRRKILLDRARKHKLGEIDPNEEMLDYFVELPPFAAYIALDGKQFYNGRPYTFTRKEINSIRDIVANAWRHEDVTMGRRDPNAYRHMRNQSIGPGSTVNTAGHFSRAMF